MKRPVRRRKGHLVKSYPKEEMKLFSVYKPAEGGLSFKDAKEMLEVAGVTGVVRGYSPYVGQHGISVPAKFEKKAREVLFGKY